MNRPKFIYMVVDSYYDIFDIDSFWYDEPTANNRCKALRRELKHVTVIRYDVEDAGVKGETP